MPLVRCPVCRGTTPSTALRCVQCGTLPPSCSDCKGSGTCPACSDPTVPVMTDSLGQRVCDRCEGKNVCPTCGGQKRRWPPAA